MNNSEEQKLLNSISNNVNNFIKKEEQFDIKINEIDDKICKMQNYFLQLDQLSDNENHINTVDNTGYKNAINNYIKKGITNDLVIKSFNTDEETGGHLLTPTLPKKITSILNAKSVMRSLASVETISNGSFEFILEDGDFASGWVDDREVREDTDTSKLLKKTIQVHELYSQPKATQRLLDDSEINLESWIIERISNQFIKRENKAFITGDGIKKPFGLLTDEDIETIDSEIEITADLLLKMINTLEEEYLSGATFLMNRTTLSKIQNLKDAHDRFIWQTSITDNFKQTIFGIPVVCSSHMPNLAAGNLFIALGNFKEAYKIVEHNNMTIMRDPYTEKPYVKFYVVKRVGGKVVNPEAVKFAKCK